VRLLAGKAALLARVDACGQDPAGEAGQRMLGEVQAMIEKWQEPPPAKQIKPLPKPDAEIKKRRRGLTCQPARLPLYRR
jgi:U4/U6 small nuclear ribonucleoprotein PRP31